MLEAVQKDDFHDFPDSHTKNLILLHSIRDDGLRSQKITDYLIQNGVIQTKPISDDVGWMFMNYYFKYFWIVTYYYLLYRLLVKCANLKFQDFLWRAALKNLLREKIRPRYLLIMNKKKSLTINHNKTIFSKESIALHNEPAFLKNVKI